MGGGGGGGVVSTPSTHTLTGRLRCVTIEEDSELFSRFHHEHNTASKLVRILNDFNDENSIYSSSSATSHQCCGFRSGIRFLFDPWIRDPGWVENHDPDPGSTTRIIFPRA
jgi:hypothetical protein